MGLVIGVDGEGEKCRVEDMGCEQDIELHCQMMREGLLGRRREEIGKCLVNNGATWGVLILEFQEEKGLYLLGNGGWLVRNGRDIFLGRDKDLEMVANVCVDEFDGEIGGVEILRGAGVVLERLRKNEQVGVIEVEIVSE